MTGELKPGKTLILRVHVAKAEHFEYGKFDLAHGPDGSPIIKSVKTGHNWLISWPELVDLAVEAGILEPEADHGA